MNCQTEEVVECLMQSHSAVEPQRYPSATTILRIAVASQSGTRVDRHFGQAEDLRIFDVNANGAELLEIRNITSQAFEGEDRRETIYRTVSDCKALLVAKIGICPQEKLASFGVEGIDRHANEEIDVALREVFNARTTPAALEPLLFSSFRLLHSIFCVTDLTRSLDFYTRLLGMTVLDKREHKKRQTTRVNLGYGSSPREMALELVYKSKEAGQPRIEAGGGHIAIEVSGIAKLCNTLQANGVALHRPPRQGDKVVACIDDPDGNRIELIERTPH